jgi:RNA polymerase sigma factor (sigma-70 family)
MSNLIDAQLLQQVSTGDEIQRRAALEVLVRRELDFVYAAAVRQANWDRHLAEDITQAVFILLARKAGQLRSGVILRDWLFVTTRYAVNNALKIEARRKFHERRAAMEKSAVSDAHEISPLRDRLISLIDEAVARLNTADRAGVLLSFFDNKTYREVGEALGVSEEAARKRVVRAIEKMRSFFASRGVTIDDANGVVAVSSVLRAGAAPEALAGSVLDAALGATGAHLIAAGSSYTVAKGVSKMLFYAKLKFAATAVAASVIVGGSGVALYAQARADDKKSAAASLPALPAAAAGAPPEARFDDGVTIECLGVRKLGSDEHWWSPGGSPTSRLCDPASSVSEPPNTHQLLFRVNHAPADAGIAWSIEPKTGWSLEHAQQNGARMEGGETITIRAEDHNAIDVTCLIAAGEWESIATCQQLDATNCTGGKHGGVIFSPIVNAPNPLAGGEPGALVTVSHDITDSQIRILGVDDNGVEHIAREGDSAVAGSVHQGLYHFEQPVEQLRTVSFQIRPYDHRATFTNITLDPTKQTTVKATATKD